MTQLKVGEGHRTYIGFAEEATFGTPALRSSFLDINSESLSLQRELLKSGGLSHLGHHTNNVVGGRRVVGGDIAYDVRYEKSELIWKTALGSVATTQPDVTGNPSVYRHAFTIKDNLHRSLTMEIFRDSSRFATNANRPFVYTGCEFDSLELSIEENGLLGATVSIIGRDEVATDSSDKSHPTLPSATLVDYGDTVVSWAGNPINCTSANIRIANNLDADRRFLGSYVRSEATRADRLEVTGSFTAEYEDFDEYADLIASTPRAFQILFTGPEITADYDYALQIDVSVARLRTVSFNIDGVGRITETCEFEAFRDDSSRELVITATNTIVSF